jgi:hypothetical protein
MIERLFHVAAAPFEAARRVAILPKAISVKEYKCSLVFSPVFCVAPTVT